MEFAVLARIEVSDEGVTLVLEDAAGGGKAWHVDELFTAKTFEADAFLNANLSASQYEDVGLNIVGRLAALHQVRVASGKGRAPQ